MQQSNPSDLQMWLRLVQGHKKTSNVKALKVAVQLKLGQGSGLVSVRRIYQDVSLSLYDYANYLLSCVPCVASRISNEMRGGDTAECRQ